MQGGEPTPNVEYLARLTESWNAVKLAMPEITTAHALPVRAADAAKEGPLAGLTGFSEPWTQELYDEKYATLTKTSGMSCALALANLDILGSSMTPWIPFDEDRIRQLIPMLFETPKQFPYVVTVPVDFGPKSGLPSSPMSTCMPLEVMHALIFAIADKVGKPGWLASRKQWYQMLLSIPCLLVRMDEQDERYAEALNKRTELFATAAVTKLTVD